MNKGITVGRELAERRQRLRTVSQGTLEQVEPLVAHE